VVVFSSCGVFLVERYFVSVIGNRFFKIQQRLKIYLVISQSSFLDDWGLGGILDIGWLTVHTTCYDRHTRI